MYQLQVEGMKCGGCASGVTRAVKSLDSAADVKVDLRAKTVSVQSMAELPAVRHIIEAAGYPVLDARAE